jgi:glucokinase
MLYQLDLRAPIELRKEAPGTVIFVQKYGNVRYPTFAAVMEAFFADAEVAKAIDVGVRPEVACLAVAGVAQLNMCRLTNLDWLIDGPALQERFGIVYVEVINDFVAQGYGVLTLGDDEVIQISGAEPTRGAVVACVGAGTGLGQCFDSINYWRISVLPI